MSASSPLPQVCEPATLLGTNISPFKGTFEDDFPFPQVGYVSVPGLPLIWCTVFVHGRPKVGDSVGHQVNP